MEYWNLYDCNRNQINRTHLRGNPLLDGDYHLVVNIWLQNSKGELLLTKRHPDKPFGNLWECTGGAVIAGEDSLTGALREMREEIGLVLKEQDLSLLGTQRRSHSFLDTWFCQKDVDLSDLTLQAEEVIDAKFVDHFTYVQMLAQNEIVSTIRPFDEWFCACSQP